MFWLPKRCSIFMFTLVWFWGQIGIAQDKPLDKSLVGEWVVLSCSRAGVADKAMAGASFSIEESAKSNLKLPNGLTKTAKFSAKLHDEKAKLFRVLIETDEDSEGLGGGGPRKGICQINDKGELQVFEALTASLDYPKDFSKDSTSTSKALVWVLSKKSKPK